MRTRKRLPFRSQASRSWSIRAKIISLLLVPLITLVAMWALATAVTLGPGLDLLDAQNNVETVGRPVQALVAEIQAERKMSMVYLASGRKDPAALTAQRSETDARVTRLRQSAGSEDARNAATDLTSQRLTELFAALDSMALLRAGVDRGVIDRASALRQYTDIVASSFLVSGSLIRAADEDLARESRALVGLGRAREILAQEDAMLSAAFAAGSLAAADLGQTVQLIGAQRFRFAETLPDLNRVDLSEYEALIATEPFTRLATLENRIVSDARAGAADPIDAASWRTSYETVATQLQEFERRAADRLVDRSGPAALVTFGQIALAGLLGLLTVVITIIASIRIARSLLKRLAGLRQAALELAVDRLPRVVSRLRRGEEVDVKHEAPPLPYGDDEIGQVGHAFNELQRTAVNSAVEEANLRRGLNEVFLNIARRSQTLLHRQLSILDHMERRADDPVELEDLFRVDHLATRMRRHAEDLVILAGATPGRGWRNAVALVDVLRGAVSEVEDYARVSIRPMPEIAVTGRAVGDIIHLLAELIENATSFSPPHTRVNVGGEMVANGFAVEIEDRGLGMSPDALAEGNVRLADPPEFDPANSAQLGLFVVARLAARHGVKVQLRPSPYGGITAVALLPEELIVAQAGEFASRSGAPRPREAVAALPSAPHGAATNNGTDSAATRGALYRELSTAQRPAIAAPPAATFDAGLSDAVDGDAEPPGAAPTDADSGWAIPRHSRQEVIEAPLSAGAEGLPRRVRQTSIAPQLRDDEIAMAGDIATQASGGRSPEQLRTMMTSFQAGMDRGRREAEDGTDGGPSERDS